jgi:hypothetical protein
MGGTKISTTAMDGHCNDWIKLADFLESSSDVATAKFVYVTVTVSTKHAMQWLAALGSF